MQTSGTLWLSFSILLKSKVSGNIQNWRIFWLLVPLLSDQLGLRLKVFNSDNAVHSNVEGSIRFQSPIAQPQSPQSRFVLLLVNPSWTLSYSQRKHLIFRKGTTTSRLMGWQFYDKTWKFHFPHQVSVLGQKQRQCSRFYASRRRALWIYVIR